MRALRMKDVSAKVALGQSKLYRMIAAGTFPKPFELVPGRTAWLEDDVDDWLARRAGAVRASPSAPTKEESLRIDELARKIASRLTPHALWDLAELAAYLHRSEQHTRQWIVTQDGFPRPIRIPSGRSSAERAHPLWRAKDVIAWVESHVEE
ncbi:AlpA family phage regulatory protein [Burkholderia cenocepacia]|uniref:helix-turn-helix transcriptional regulator n=2 Tax=Burkholderia cenocepacia TaxID=95486 RepID=UPI001BAA8DD2|nr:AlpA family phage regulatory protein [Burkholderia cenocepacia]QUO24424.1 AlpA family phage regulatory protein [Burkholderia cenocepacia]